MCIRDRNKLLKLALAVSSLAFTSTTQAQNANSLLGKLFQPAAATQPMTTDAPYNSPNSADLAQPSPMQIAALDKLLNQRAAKPTLSKALISAKPVLERTIMTSACASSATALNQLNEIRLRPETYDNSYASNYDIAKHGMSYHDVRQCTTVARINFKFLAANAFSAEVFYLSPSSAEATHQILAFRYVGESGWLIETIGGAFKQ